MKYELRALNDVSEYIARGVTPAYCEEGRGVPVLNQKCIRNNVVSMAEARRTDPTKRKVAPQKRLELYDVLVNSTGVGTLGRTAQVREIKGEVTVDSHVTIVRPAQGLNPVFFGYALQWREPQIEALAEGSTGQTELSRVRLGAEVRIPVPPPAAQQAIGEMLAALDVQVENARAMCLVLEQQAAAMYGQWFEQAVPAAATQGDLPPGWRLEMIGNLPLFIADFVANGSFAALKENVNHYDTPHHAIFVRNVDLKSMEFGKYVDQPSYEFLAKTRLLGGEVIISNVGDVGSVYLCPVLPRPMTLGNNMILLNSTDDVSLNYYLYLFFRSERGKKLLETITGGSVQMKFNKTDFRALRIPVPPQEMLAGFNDIVKDFFELQNTCRAQIQTIRSLRDGLLPRLMTGEIQL